MRLEITNWRTHFECSDSKKTTSLKWVAVPNKTHGAGYNFLVDHENGAAHLGAWLAIIQASSKSDQSRRGQLPQGFPATLQGVSESLSRTSRLKSGVFAEAIPRLLCIGWLTDTDPCGIIESTTSAVLGEPRTTSEKRENPPTTLHNSTLHNSTEQTPLPTVVGGQQYSPAFLSWWGLYWNSKDKHSASKEYASAGKALIAGGMSREDAVSFLAAKVVEFREVFSKTETWFADEKLYACRWLKRKRWEELDELERIGVESVQAPARTIKSDFDLDSEEFLKERGFEC